MTLCSYLSVRNVESIKESDLVATPTVKREEKLVRVPLRRRGFQCPNVVNARETHLSLAIDVIVDSVTSIEMKRSKENYRNGTNVLERVPSAIRWCVRTVGFWMLMDS